MKETAKETVASYLDQHKIIGSLSLRLSISVHTYVYTDTRYTSSAPRRHAALQRLQEAGSSRASVLSITSVHRASGGKYWKFGFEQGVVWEISGNRR